MRSRAPVAVALASLVALFVVGCGPKAAEGTTTATLDVGGRTRSYAYHLPPQHPIARLPLVGRLKRLHTTHHDPTRMASRNFNITYPLGDWLFGTLERR